MRSVILRIAFNQDSGIKINGALNTGDGQVDAPVALVIIAAVYLIIL